jgi:hypothetical protein
MAMQVQIFSFRITFSTAMNDFKILETGLEQVFYSFLGLHEKPPAV